jgi:hypothetical protein
MKRTALALILASLGTLPAPAQEKATTLSGKAILVFPDGTWREEQKTDFKFLDMGQRKPRAATAKASILKGKATIFYNPSKWKTKGKEEGGRSSFTHVDGDAQAMIICERIQMPLETLETAALANAKGAAPDSAITRRETRKVNGLDVVMLQIQGTIQKTPFTYLNYYYSGEAGIIQVITFTSRNLFKEYQPDFEDFLNGITLEPSL